MLWVVGLVASCTESGLSPQDEIRQFIETGVEAAENHSLDDLGARLHPDYLDQKGYNKKQLVTLLRGFFFRHKNIYLLTRIGEIDLIADNQAVVNLHVAMAGTVISDIDALANLRAQLYEFELLLIKNDEWRVQYSKWRPASIAELQ